MTKKPNVLLILTDDQRFDTISALGNSEVGTPNLDQLVRSGVSFTHAHIPGGTVGAVCMPSRAMLHTGRTLFHLEKDGSMIPDHHVLLGEMLQQAGYRTFGTGKWHNGTDAYARSFSAGDEIFFGGMGDHWNVPAYHYDPSGKYEQKHNIIDNPFFENKVRSHHCDHVTNGKHSSELFTECATNWLEQEPHEDPFFMYISFMAPHDPRSMPEEFMHMYDPDKIKLPDNFMEVHPFDYGVSTIRDELLASYPRTEREIRSHIAEYYAMITHLDHQLGNVIDSLKKTGEYDNTIIVFAGDNGLALGQHGLMGKQSAYEHSVRVPLIFAGPGIPRNETRDSYAYLLDIYPSLCELIGLEIPESVEGVSLVPAIRNPKTVIRESLYFSYADLVRAVKYQQYKLIEYRSKDIRETQLFDLTTDPAETNNLYGHDGYETITNDLKDKMLSYRDQWEDLGHPTSKKFWSLYE